MLPLTDQHGYMMATTDIGAGNLPDAFNLKPQLPSAVKAIKRRGVSITGAYFKADRGCDTLDACKVCFNHPVLPTLADNKRNRKSATRGRNPLFNATVYKERCVCERSFAWIDKFRALVVRFDLKKIYFMGCHFLAFALINLRESLA